MRVCSSVQPGTAKPLGTGTGWLGRKWRSGGLARCTVAALAEAHKVTNRPKTKTDHMVLSPNLGCDLGRVRQADHMRTGSCGHKLSRLHDRSIDACPR